MIFYCVYILIHFLEIFVIDNSNIKIIFKPKPMNFSYTPLMFSVFESTSCVGMPSIVKYFNF